MSRSKRRTPAQERAIHSQREALQAAKQAVAEWAAKNQEQREVIASAMIERLGECATDTDGDETLEVVSELFEEHFKKMPNHVAHALEALALTARVLGRLARPPQR
jgi:hypothetical protein